MLDADLKAKWIAALRSGEYEQARGAIFDEEVKGYCCLGVLLRVQGCDIEQQYPDVSTRCTSIIPIEYRGNLTHEETSDLAYRNDGSGEFRASRHSFAQIADYIEKAL